MRIRNWHKFQHFKDRRPPWIKLYRDLLDDIEWFELEAEAAKLLVMLWLIASENDGNLPDRKTLLFRLRTSEKKLDESLSKLSRWVERDDINTISNRCQGDTPETEKKDGEREKSLSSAGAAVPSNEPRVSKVELFVGWWNEKAPAEIARCRQLTPDRAKKIAQRLNEHPESEFWKLVMANIHASDFLCGREPGKSWRVDIDFVIANGRNCVRIAEGAYGTKRTPAAPPDIHDRLAVHS